MTKALRRRGGLLLFGREDLLLLVHVVPGLAALVGATSILTLLGLGCRHEHGLLAFQLALFLLLGIFPLLLRTGIPGWRGNRTTLSTLALAVFQTTGLSTDPLTCASFRPVFPVPVFTRTTPLTLITVGIA